MKKPKDNVSHERVTVSLLLICCMGWTTDVSDKMNLTTVEVSFDLERPPQPFWAKPILDALDPSVQDALVKEIEAEAVKHCSKQLGYLDWVCASQATSTGTTRARLEIVMKAQRVTGYHVYLECTLIVEGKRKSPLTATVYGIYDILPDRASESQEDIRQEICKRAKAALVTLIPDGSTLGGAIPLSDTIHIGNHRLILDVSAERINADRDSRFQVAFVGNVPNETPEEGYIEIRPGGRVLAEDDPLFGMQKCVVTYFEYEPDEENGWHPRIPVVIEHRVLNSLRIYIKEYKSQENELVATPD
jgi:hypothetical protein